MASSDRDEAYRTEYKVRDLTLSRREYELVERALGQVRAKGKAVSRQEMLDEMTKLKIRRTN